MYTSGWLTSTEVVRGYPAFGAPSWWSSSAGVSGTTTWTTPLWPSSTTIDHATVSRGRAYAWYDNGLLQARSAPAKFTENYVYDPLRQLEEVQDGVGTTLEQYTYDAAGNVTSQVDRAGSAWTSIVGPKNQVLGRGNAANTVGETTTYDNAGRTDEVWTSPGNRVERHRYDGLGRLVTVEDETGQVWRYQRDAAGSIARRVSPGGAVTRTVDGWQWESGVTRETVTPTLTYKGTERQWQLLDVDGTSVVTAGDQGLVVGHRRPAAYGQRYIEVGDPERRTGYHGSHEEDGPELIAMGVRHLGRRDGRWLQPEPLLYTAPDKIGTASPRALATYRYAANAPTTYKDPGGKEPAALSDAAPSVNVVVLIHPSNKASSSAISSALAQAAQDFAAVGIRVNFGAPVAVSNVSEPVGCNRTAGWASAHEVQVGRGRDPSYGTQQAAIVAEQQGLSNAKVLVIAGSVNNGKLFDDYKEGGSVAAKGFSAVRIGGIALPGIVRPFKVVAHELGHLLGLPKEDSTDKTSIMSNGHFDEGQTFTEADGATMRQHIRDQEQPQ